ncbi:cell adhesion molecule DSCAM-like [Ptychodera flava]|uniref:cell adhesion molecule DSCAM-like n=1 Tax=Ptychodera flava TaxID=63121 RepID=UPI003969F556
MGFTLIRFAILALNIVLKFNALYADPFVYGPSDTTAIAGTTATMSCKLAHHWKDFNTVDWYVDGSSVAFRRSKNNNGVHTLTIVGVNKTDEGNYTCVFRGVSSSTAQLQVLQIPKPSLVEQPVSVQSLRDKDIRFDCKIKNFNADYMEVYWIKGHEIVAQTIRPNTDLLPMEDSRYAIQTEREAGYHNFKLRIREVTVYDSGYFQCRVLLVGQRYILFSDSAKLFVIHPPHSQYPRCSLRKPKPVYEENDNIVTDCMTRGGNAPVSLSWSKNERKWNSSLVTYIHRNHYMYTRRTWELSPDDNGAVITCTLEGDAILTDRKCTIGPLVVRFKPILSINPRIDRVNCGEVASITCSARANPIVSKYRWLIDDKVISDSDSRFEVVHAKHETSLKLYNSLGTPGTVSVNITCEVINTAQIKSVDTIALQEKAVTKPPSTRTTTVKLSLAGVIFESCPTSTVSVTKEKSVIGVTKGYTVMARNAMSLPLYVVISLVLAFVAVVIVVVTVVYIYCKKRRDALGCEAVNVKPY